MSKAKPPSSHINNNFWIHGPTFLEKDTEELAKEGNVERILKEQMNEAEVNSAEREVKPKNSLINIIR